MIEPREVTRRDILLATRRGFMAVYWAELRQHRTCHECYEHLEGRRLQVYGERLYASWETYRVAMARARGEALPEYPQ